MATNIILPKQGLQMTEGTITHNICTGKESHLPAVGMKNLKSRCGGNVYVRHEDPQAGHHINAQIQQLPVGKVPEIAPWLQRQLAQMLRKSG